MDMITIAAVVGVLVTGVLVVQSLRIRKLETKLTGLVEHLDMFVETSGNVARSVDRLVHQPSQTDGTGYGDGPASRRW